MKPALACSLLLLVVGALLPAAAAEPGDAVLKAVTLYASFDEGLRADVGGGDLTLWTRSNDPKEKGKFLYEKGFDDKAFRVAKGKGVAGGCLEATDVLPNNGRLYFPARGNIAFKKDGWGATLSVWINTDPNKLFKTPFCDPIQITQKGANNGGIWFDFNDAKPRDLRMGVFPAVADPKLAVKEEDPRAPMVRVKDVGLKSGDWHHVVLTWDNLDTGKKDALATLYIDAKKIGDVKDRDLAMDWEVEKAGIYVAVNYIGLLDELALFNRPLTADEVTLLHKQPGMLAALKKPGGKGDTRLHDLQRRLAALAQKKPEVPPAPRFPFDAATACRYQKDYAAALGLPVEFTNGLGMTFVLAPPGTFLMGSPANEPGHNADETQHEVTLTRPFYLCKHETTVGQFRRFVEATKYVTDVEKNGGGHAHDVRAVWIHRPGTEWRKPGFAGPFEPSDEHPVVHVSRTDSRRFCKWLQEQSGTGTASGLVYDLPTEAEWEWACRAGSGDRYWWGADEDTTGRVANVGDRSLKKVHPEWPRGVMDMDDGHAFVAPVGSYRPNGFGLHDMLGNVWEFCSTRTGPYPKEAVTDPGDIDPNGGFAVRGGGWSNSVGDVRCATRNADPPDFGHSNLGFRVALRLPAP
jgi:formylglycine-generating enzyme required for sulfatase activity